MKDQEKKLRRPDWLKVRLGKKTSATVRRRINDSRLHTVCQAAACPNIGECFESGTATFLIMGDVCTRGCRFCNIQGGQPMPLDADEPRRVAETIKEMKLTYAVVTSVTRDDVEDGGASHFAATISEIRKMNPGCKIEVLIPDLQGDESALQIVLQAAPDVLNHNVETVPRIYDLVRPGADYKRSLDLLTISAASGLPTKSGLMVGIGESLDEIKETITDIAGTGTSILTIGQYLRPSRQHLPVERYVTPQEFEELGAYALKAGFKKVESAPLVRSSYHAAETLNKD
jgi:lipoic acid synthetase